MPRFLYLCQWQEDICWKTKTKWVEWPNIPWLRYVFMFRRRCIHYWREREKRQSRLQKPLEARRKLSSLFQFSLTVVIWLLVALNTPAFSIDYKSSTTENWESHFSFLSDTLWHKLLLHQYKRTQRKMIPYWEMHTCTYPWGVTMHHSAVFAQIFFVYL